MEKKLLGPVESFLRENPEAATAGRGLTSALRTELADEALLALLRCCQCPASDPGHKVPPDVVAELPALWGTFVLSDLSHRLGHPVPGTLDKTGYSADPEEAEAQLLARWMEILGVTHAAFRPEVKAGGFAESWDWFVEIFIGDTLEGMAVVPDKMLFSQARRVVAQIPPNRKILIERFIDYIAQGPDRYDDLPQ
ncbi:MAG: hypothetical protein P8Z30_20715 [Acidobacteriota bacterium]